MVNRSNHHRPRYDIAGFQTNQKEMLMDSAYIDHQPVPLGPGLLNKSVKIAPRWNHSCTEDYFPPRKSEQISQEMPAGVSSGFIGTLTPIISLINHGSIERFELNKYNPKDLKQRQR